MDSILLQDGSALLLEDGYALLTEEAAESTELVAGGWNSLPITPVN